MKSLHFLKKAKEVESKHLQVERSRGGSGSGQFAGVFAAAWKAGEGCVPWSAFRARARLAEAISSPASKPGPCLRDENQRRNAQGERFTRLITNFYYGHKRLQRTACLTLNDLRLADS